LFRISSLGAGGDGTKFVGHGGLSGLLTSFVLSVSSVLGSFVLAVSAVLYASCPCVFVLSVSAVL